MPCHKGNEVSGRIADIVNHCGVPKVLIHNPAHLYVSPLIKTPIEEFELAWRSMVLTAFNVFQAVLPGMVLRDHDAVAVQQEHANWAAQVLEGCCVDAMCVDSDGIKHENIKPRLKINMP